MVLCAGKNPGHRHGTGTATGMGRGLPPAQAAKLLRGGSRGCPGCCPGMGTIGICFSFCGSLVLLGY